jgi:hypothetical protein
LPLLGTANDADSIAEDPDLAGPLRGALERYVRAIEALAGDESRLQQSLP